MVVYKIKQLGVIIIINHIRLITFYRHNKNKLALTIYSVNLFKG